MLGSYSNPPAAPWPSLNSHTQFSTWKPPQLFHQDFIQQRSQPGFCSHPSRPRLCSPESHVPQRWDEGGGRTNRRLAVVRGEGQAEQGGEETEIAHLVADGLVLEPWLVQDPLQLLVVKVGHADGLGQSCVLTLLQGLGRKVCWSIIWNGL